MKIIDIHTHVGDLINGWPLDEAYTKPALSPGMIAEWTGYRTSKPPFGMRTITRYLEVIHNHQRNNLGTERNLDFYSSQAGVTNCLVLPIEPFVKTDDIIEMCRSRRDSGRNSPHLSPFASIDPRDPFRMEKLHRFMQSGCFGLKMHPIIQNLPLTDPLWFEIIEEYRCYKKPVLMHSGVSQYYIPEFRRAQYGDVSTYEKLPCAFPDVPFIFGHMGMLQFELVWEFAQRYENVYAEASFQCARNIKGAFNSMGEDRVLYASDFPFSLPGYAVRVGMAATKGSSSLREKFFFRNARALLGELN
jgi:predicted TIM-barrel fold metal-dependent hydrolase